MDIEQFFTNLNSVALYLTIALLGLLVIVGALVFFLKRENFASFKKYALGIAVGYAVSVFVIMAYVESVKVKSYGFETSSMYGMLFYPVLAMLVVIIAGALSMFICSLFNKKATKIAGLVTLAGVLGAFIAIMVEMSEYYKLEQGNYPGANTTGLIVSGIVFIAVIVVIYFLGDKRKISDTRSLVFGAVAIALSFALSYIKFFEMPQGGSVTFASLLPLMIYCCMFGTRRGVIVCLVYGVLQAFQDPWVIHPMQFLLDYPLAFGTIGISGIFIEKGVFKGNKKVLGFLLGGVIAVTLRYACHVCSGVFAFADLADLDKYSSALAYSFGYNSFAFIDMIIVLVAGALLFASKGFAAQMAKSSDMPVEGGEAQSADVYADDDDDNDEIDLEIIRLQNGDDSEVVKGQTDEGEIEEK